MSYTFVRTHWFTEPLTCPPACLPARQPATARNNDGFSLSLSSRCSCAVNLLEEVVEVSVFEVLEDHERGSVGADSVEGDDVFVVKRRQQLRFTVEVLERLLHASLLHETVLPCFNLNWLSARVARYYWYTGVPRYLGVPVRYRGIYEYKYSTAVCGHHTVFY